VPDVRIQGDPIPAVKARFADFYGIDLDAADPGDAFRIVDEVPGDWVVETDRPLLVVDDDGGGVDWPVMSKPIVRVTVWANGKQTAKLLRRIVMGVLLAQPVPGIAHIRKTGIGYTDARDDETGADLASFTVNATVRTEVVTV
jgi:hypothetical protein